MRYRGFNYSFEKQAQSILCGYCALILFMLLFPCVFNAQDNNIAENKNLGFRFTVPQFWDLKETEGLYLLTNQNDAGFVMVNSWQHADINILKAQFEEGVKKENGFFLSPAEAIELINTKKLQGKFSGLINYSPVVVYLVLIQGEQQQTVLIVSAIAKEDYSEKQETIAKEVADRFQFFKPEMPSLIDEYKDLLKNTRLISASPAPISGWDNDEFSDNASETKTSIGLCPNGFFDYQSTVTGNNVAVFATGNISSTGRWRVQKSTEGNIVLSLLFDDGEIIKYELIYIEGKLYLNDKLFIRITNSTNNNQLICE